MPVWIPPRPPRDDRPAGEKGFVSLRDTFAAAALTGLLANEDLLADDDKVAETAYELADAMLRERGNHSEKPNSPTNHDAVPEARATTKPGGLNSGSASGTSGEQSPVTKPSSGTGDTQEPVAWAVMQNDWYHGAYLDYSKAVSLATAANVAGAKNPWNVVPLYRSPTLTDAERADIATAAASYSGIGEPVYERIAATLRGLLERTK